MGVGHSPEELFDFDPALLLGHSVDVFLDVFKKGAVPGPRPAAQGGGARQQTIQEALLQLAERWGGSNTRVWGGL